MMHQLKIKRRLVDIVQDFRQLLITIHDNEGEVEESLIKELDQCEEHFEMKVESCLLVAEEFAHQAEAYKNRAKALADHAKALDNRAKRLRDLVRDSMIALTIHKIKTPSFSSVYLRENHRLEILDPRSVIDYFDGNEDVLTYQDPKISKTELKKHLENPESTAWEDLKNAVEFVKSISLMVR